MVDMERRSALRRVLAVVLSVVAVGAVAIYVTKPQPGNGPSATAGGTATVTPQAQAPKATAPDGAPIGAFVRKPKPEALPNVTFQDGNGQPVALESFRGKVVLLNLWATWCVPCRKEMPALDRLQAALGSDEFEVVALSIDRSGVAGARKFLDSIGIAKLKLYADPSAKLGNDLKAIGLPTTILIDRQGREIGRLIGPAEWDDADAKALVQAALKGS